MSKIIGIDLGTTNSCVAVVEGGQPFVIANAEGSRITPSVAAFSRNGERIVGQAAKCMATANPGHAVLSAMRAIGTANKIQAAGKSYCSEQLCSFLLRNMKETAESYLGEPVTQAVISVPACFNSCQRQAVIDAGRIAGLDVRIISEPAAAALAYSLGSEENQHILVFGMGGGHTDVSIQDIGDGVFGTCDIS